MKFSLVVLLAVVSGTQAFASTYSVSSNLNHITDRVTKCSVLPFSIENGQTTYHEMMSHCPEVKVVSPGQAKIKVAGHVYNASLSASVDSDGDFYEVTISDTRSGEFEVISNVAAYGDILLGILKGNTSKVAQQQIVLGLSGDIDANLLK